MPDPAPAAHPPSPSLTATTWIHDVFGGMAVVGTALLALAAYALASRGHSTWGSCVLLAALGTALGIATRITITGRRPNPSDILTDACVTGGVLALAGPVHLLTAPSCWRDLLTLSPACAAALILLYHGVNVGRAFARHRGWSMTSAATLVLLPFLAGWLMLLDSPVLLARLGGPLAGRMLVLALFLAVLASLLNGLLTRRPTPPRLLLLSVACGTAPVLASLLADAGASATLARAPQFLQPLGVIACVMLAQAGLWGMVYLMTGMILDGIKGQAPTYPSAKSNLLNGLKRGAVYGGVFFSIVMALGLLTHSEWIRESCAAQPLLAAALGGALLFPLLKTLIETFDGSTAFFSRLFAAWKDGTLWLRGLVAGGGLGWFLAHRYPDADTVARSLAGFAIGSAAYAGITLFRDLLMTRRQQGRPPPWRVLLLELLLGGAIGAAIGFYLDDHQIRLITHRIQAYIALGQDPAPNTFNPLLNKWGSITLGSITGGANRFFYESVAGVIVWAIPAWLFALNATFMRAAFQRESGPIRNLFSRDGFRALGENMIYVLRWGLWMAPIINTFLRPMADPTWYNQDGAIRTLVATAQQLHLTPDAFHAWSLGLFTSMLAHDPLRILIWLDHMGLRVATLVNLSFIGVDRLESRLARRLAPWSTGRCIPEAIKRFATWAPLLIPYYIPMGQDWDIAWNGYKAIDARGTRSLLDWLLDQPWTRQLSLAALLLLFVILTLWLIRRQRQSPSCAPADRSLSNTAYEVVLRHTGALQSRSLAPAYDLTRRDYDPLDPAGRALFIVDTDQNPTRASRSWPVLGNFPGSRASRATFKETDTSLIVHQFQEGIDATITITLPDGLARCEQWRITVRNPGTGPRRLKVIPYLEWVLNHPDADRGHTQYNRLFSELEYAAEARTLRAWDTRTGVTGFLACDAAPDGILTSRIDFIGRACSLWKAHILESLAFHAPEDTDLHPTFDPIASFCIPLELAPGAESTLTLYLGMADSRDAAARLVARLMGTGHNQAARPADASRLHPIRHGEIPPGTPPHYYTWLNSGQTLRILTPFTPRPYDHMLSNRHGHMTLVTNRGLHTTANGNSQQNRITPDWPDTVTRENPSEAFYLYDPEALTWYSPTYHPLNDTAARYETDFGLDGTAVFRMRKADLETEMTVFVPPDANVTVYLLTIRNLQDQVRILRLAPFFQMALADVPERANPLIIRRDDATGALLFRNPGNTFRAGPAFAVLSTPATIPEVVRNHFIGPNQDPTRPAMVERGSAASELPDDHHPVAAFLTELELPANGETTVSFILGQADDPLSALALIRTYSPVPMARLALKTTQEWWLAFSGALAVQTSTPEFDRLLPWLAYQTLAERIWARRGFYQTSGAYGFRDQLQDSINLIWIDSSIARQQIILHAAQQFIEGDVVHWFHVLPGHRTGMVARTHASDNLLWLPWGVVEYVQRTGDESLLDECTPYLEAEQPFPELPEGRHGMGFVPLRSPRVDTIYRHSLLALDRVLTKRLGKHGLPLMGTGDWNDGLDCIGSEGRGESVWLGFFLDIILAGFIPLVEKKEGAGEAARYRAARDTLRTALESCWREDRYLRAFHDDGTEIGLRGSGVWEIDALTAAWAVASNINPERARKGFDTALSILEQDKGILLGYPPLRVNTKPYLGRSSNYPEGVRENGMYCHGVQWLAGAARTLAENARQRGNAEEESRYRDTAWRLWNKIAPLSHSTPEEIEIFGGQPNKQPADYLTAYDPGRMIWHGYTGAAGWMLRQAMESVLGLRLEGGHLQYPPDWAAPRGPVIPIEVNRTASSIVAPPKQSPP